MTRPNTASDFRPPPQALEAEDALLGSLMIDREAITKVSAFLRADDFYRERNGTIYRAMVDLLNRNEPADFVTLCNELERQGKLPEVGGAAYLVEITNATPTSTYAEHYGRLIERTGVRRRLIQAAGRLIQLAYDEDDPDAVIDSGEAMLYELRRRRSTEKLISPAERIKRAYDRYEAAKRGEVPGLPWGFVDLDTLTQGAHKGELILVGGRPSMGKTGCMQNMAENQAQSGAKVLFCSAEMPETQLTDRYVAAEMKSSVHALESGMFPDGLWDRFTEHKMVITPDTCVPWVYDDADMTVASIRSVATEMRSRHGLDAIYVDYVQLLHDHGHQGETERVTVISRNLKALSRALDVAVIAGSQLNRACEARPDKIPGLSDLRESGGLEQDADVVLLLFRPAYYFKPDEWQSIAPGDPYENACRVSVAKQRNGPRGVHIYLRFDPQKVRFESMDRRHERNGHA